MWYMKQALPDLGLEYLEHRGELGPRNSHHGPSSFNEMEYQVKNGYLEMWFNPIVPGNGFYNLSLP